MVTTSRSLVLTNRVGDHMPDKAAIHLPSMLTVKTVHERMKEEFEADQRIVISLPHFYYLWNEWYPHVSIPTVSNTYKITRIALSCTKVASLPWKINFHRKIASQNVIHVA